MSLLVSAVSDSVQGSIVTGATAVISGVIGYAAARGQQRLEERKLTAEETRASRAFREKALADKRETYIAYLRATNEFLTMIRNPQSATDDDFMRIWHEYEHEDNRVRLLATQDVNDRCSALNDVLTRGTIQVQLGEERLAVQLANALTSVREDIDERGRAVLEGLRNELAAESQRLAAPSSGRAGHSDSASAAG